MPPARRSNRRRRELSSRRRALPTKPVPRNSSPAFDAQRSAVRDLWGKSRSRSPTRAPTKYEMEVIGVAVTVDVDGLVKQIQNKRCQIEIPGAEKLDIERMNGKLVYQCRLCEMQSMDRVNLKVC